MQPLAAITDHIQKSTSNQDLIDLVQNLITEQSSSIPQILDLLTPNLIHQDAYTRDKSFFVYCQLIELKVDTITPIQGSKIIHTLSARCNDPLSIPHIPHCICTLITKSLYIPNTDVHLLLNSIFTELNVQSFTQTLRHQFYQIFYLLVSRHNDLIKQTDMNFVPNYLAVIESEKDPRNLIVIFKTVYLVMIHFDIPHTLIHDIFEACFCYFPITFKANPNDVSVSVNDLKYALAKIFASSPKFAKYVIPNVLDKLESSNVNAKLDALSLLTIAIPNYPNLFVSHIDRLWQALKHELSHSVHAGHEQVALTLLTCLVRTLTITSDSKSNPVDLIVKPAITDALSLLTSDPSSKLAKVSVFILGALVHADSEVAESVIASIFPVLLHQILQSESDELLDNLKSQVFALTHILYACTVPKFRLTSDSTSLSLAIFSSTNALEMVPFSESQLPKPPRSLIQFVNDLHTVFFISLRTQGLPSLQVLGLQGMYHLIMIPGLIDPMEVGGYLNHLTDVLEVMKDTDPNNPDPQRSITPVQRESMILLTKISQTYPELIRRSVLPKILNTGSTNNYSSLNSLQLEALIGLASKSVLFPEIVLALLARLGQAVDMDGCNQYVSQLLDTLRAIVTNAETVHKDLLLGLLHVEHVPSNQTDLDTMTFIAGTMMSKIETPESQAEIVNVILGSPMLVVNDPKFPIHASILCNLRKSTPLPVDELCLMSKVYSQMTAVDSMPVTMVAILISSLVNKSSSKVYENEQLKTLFCMPSNNAGQMTCFVYITKSLVMRGDVRGYQMLSELLDNLVSERDLTVRARIAAGLGVIVGEVEGALSKQSFASIKPLYKQRVFNQCMPVIQYIMDSSIDADKDIAITALGHLVNQVPIAVFLNAADLVIPMFLVALDRLTDHHSSTLIVILDTIKCMTNESVAILSKHLSTLVPQLMKLMDPAQYSMKVRLSALDTCTKMTKLPVSVALPVKHTVIRTLVSKVVGDPKRKVRQAAVHCRSVWDLVVDESG